MSTATLNENRLATQAGEITVYNFDATSREYLSTTVEYLAIGVGIPANSTLDKPLVAKEGFAVRRSATQDGWEYIYDHRGETVYDITNGKPIVITEPGDYPTNVTNLAPATPYDKWDGSAWVTDAAAQQAALIADTELKKTQLLNLAKERISLWQTELQLGIIADANRAALTNWVQYIQALQTVDSGLAPDINWPEQPQ